MEHCCEKMRYFIMNNDKNKVFDSDDIIYYAPNFDEYGVIVHDGGSSYITIQYNIVRGVG